MKKVKVKFTGYAVMDVQDYWREVDAPKPAEPTLEELANDIRLTYGAATNFVCEGALDDWMQIELEEAGPDTDASAPSRGREDKGITIVLDPSISPGRKAS